MTNPTQGVDDVVHQRHRLGILTVAAETDQVEFSYLKEVLELTPGNLNRHLAVLEDAGYVVVKKGFIGRKQKTWVQITRSGRTALAQEISTLEGLVQRLRLNGNGASKPS